MLGLGATCVGVWALGMRGVSLELAWCEALPFELDGYVETLASAPSSPARLQVELSFLGPAPASEPIGDALAAVDPAARVERDVPLVLVNGPLACPLDEPHGNTPVREWLRALVQQVLLPLHRAYPLARVVVRRAA